MISFMRVCKRQLKGLGPSNSNWNWQDSVQNLIRQGFIVTFKLPNTVQLYFFFFSFFPPTMLNQKHLVDRHTPPFITHTVRLGQSSNITQFQRNNYVIYLTYASSFFWGESLRTFIVKISYYRLKVYNIDGKEHPPTTSLNL